MWKSNSIKFPKTVCLIVYGRLEGQKRKAGRIPRINSSNEAMERDFLRRNKTRLWIRESSAHHYTFAELLGKSDG
jgi:hypothetical protein